MSFQMILVISSPSSSTTGFLTLIFLKEEEDILRRCRLGLCESTNAALGIWCEALKMAVLDVEETALVEARKQRKAELFISTEEAPWPSTNCSSWTLCLQVRSEPQPLFPVHGFFTRDWGVGGVTVSAAMFAVASLLGCNVMRERGVARYDAQTMGMCCCDWSSRQQRERGLIEDR
jgi:hypothetical protein